MKTKIYLDDDPSGFGKNCTVNMHNVVTLIKSIFNGNYNHYHLQVIEYYKTDGL